MGVKRVLKCREITAYLNADKNHSVETEKFIVQDSTPSKTQIHVCCACLYVPDASETA